MTSTYTTRNRFNKQGDGDNTNTWGAVLNSGVFDMMDAALDGWTYLTPGANVTLSTANGVTDQARSRGLKYQSGSVAVTTTLPALEKLYLVWNASTADQILASSGGGTTATVRAGELVWIACDATNVTRVTLLSMESKKLSNLATGTASNDAVNLAQMNAAINAAAFSSGSFGVPISAGNAGQFLSNDGTNPLWKSLTTSMLGDYASDQASRAATIQSNAVAQANSFAVCMALLF